MAANSTSVKSDKNNSRTKKGEKKLIDWKPIREEIVSRLKPRFVEIYESWGAKFTRVSGHKAECCAIGRDDKRASAVVFMDNGRYHDSGGGGKNYDIFDAAIHFGGATDPRAALEMLAKEAGVELPSRPAKSPRPARSARSSRTGRVSTPKANGKAIPPTEADCEAMMEDHEKNGDFEKAKAIDAAVQKRLAKSQEKNFTTNEKGISASDTDPHMWARFYIHKTCYKKEPTIHVYRGAWYQWREGRYVQVTKEEVGLLLTKFVRKWMDKEGLEKNGEQIRVTPKLIGEIRNALASEVLLDGEVEPPFWITQSGPYKRGNFIAAKDGIVDLDRLLADPMKNYMLEPSPGWFSLARLPYPVSKPGSASKWLAFLRHNLREKNGKDNSDKRCILQEFAGYLLYPNTDQQKFLVLVGEGSNGKSVVCAALTAMLGDPNVSNVPLELFDQRFALASTIGKLANIASEIGELDKAAEGYLKAFTDGSRMFFDRKGIPGIEIRPTARLILATNNMPRFSDRSKALWRRMIAMPFFVEIGETERIKGMDKPEYWANELTGIFHWAVDGLRRLLRDGFTESPECSVFLEECKRDSNPARVFLEETCEEKEGESIVTNDLYKNYRKWCEENGTHPLGERVFGKEVKRAFPKMERQRGSSRANREYSYVGIGYIDEYAAALEQPRLEG